jgi:dipeptidyl aminopeptidase/acylaminoacyl peptidase
MAEETGALNAADHGAWVSPVSAHEVATRVWRPAWVDFVGDELWWTIPTPAQGGRVRLLRESAPSLDVLAEPWSVRTGFVEYGGKPFAGYVGPNGPAVVFTEWSDQRLYLCEPDSGRPEPRPLTSEPRLPSGIRYADPQIVAEHDEVWCVREEFHSAEPTDVTRAIVAVPLDGSGEVRVLIDGAENQRFLANPRCSPDGRRLSWIGWDHPEMPWDAAGLYVAELDEKGVPGPVRHVAGGDGVAIAQAEWLDADTLVYSGDATGWWNLYTARWDGADARRIVAAEEEFGGALWSPGLRWFTVLPDGRHLAALHGRTVKSLSVYDVAGLEPVRHIEASYTCWVATLAADATGRRLATQAGSPDTPHEIVALDLADGRVDVVAAADDPFAARWAPEARVATFRAAQDGREIHANIYLPRNPDHVAAHGADRRPTPFVVFVHGGPTGSAPLVYDPEIVYFTSRGLGVVDVNYGGSTGYGRAYRERLRGQWGVVDVEDCAAVVAALVAEGTADGSRIAIRGGSAGGWTTAAALAADAGAGLYCCGTIRFPVLDPVIWRSGGTHDLESQYLESLVGPWPQAAAHYREVSPLERSDRIAVPFVLLQGLEDAVCPPEQTRVLLDRVAAGAAAAGAGGGSRPAFAYLAFEGEQHGFRRASTIVAALEAELSLYGQAMGFDPPGVPRLELDA